MATLTKDPLSGTYTVKQGDDLTKIATSKGITLQELLATNPQYQANPNLIRPGEKVILPNGPFGVNAAGDNYARPQTQTNTGGFVPPATLGSTGGSSSSSANTKFTEALIKILRDAQGRNATGQNALDLQTQGIQARGLTDAAANFRNPYLTPEAGTSLGLNAPGEYSPSLTSIENQQKRAAQGLGDIKDIIDLAGTNYQAEQDRVEKAREANIKSSTIPLTTTDKQALLLAGFDQPEIAQIESDISSYGIDEVISDPTMSESQKTAIKTVYGSKTGKTVTKPQLEAMITSKVAYDGMKEAFTTEELFDMAKTAGYASFWTNKDKDIERYLVSPQAKLDYIEMLYKQYQAAGMAL